MIFTKTLAGPFPCWPLVEQVPLWGPFVALTSSPAKGVCQAAVDILFALSEEGAKTVEDAMDILHDYRLQAKENASLHNKHAVAGKPSLKDGVWHCPDCNRRVAPMPG